MTYAFVQTGSFSNANAPLREALDAKLAIPSRQIQARDDRRLGYNVVANVPPGTLPSLVFEYRDLVRKRQFRSFLNSRYATSGTFKYQSQRARTAITAIAEPDFVFQTMTLCDASVPGVPYFIYTDHTVLNNRNYPRPTASVRHRAKWIELERTAYQRADHIFATSSFAGESLTRDYGVPRDRWTVVGSGSNVPFPAVPTVGSHVRRKVLFVGLDWQRKGGPELLKAFADARSEFPDATLTIAGAAPDTRGQPGVHVVGPVKPHQVGDLMRAADIFCMPSWIEPSAFVYSEAAAYGLPVVATTVGGTPERVLHEQTGLLAEAGDVASLAEHLKRLMADPLLAYRMGSAGSTYSREHFTWAAVADKIAAIVRRELSAESCSA